MQKRQSVSIDRRLLLHTLHLYGVVATVSYIEYALRDSIGGVKWCQWGALIFELTHGQKGISCDCL